MIRFLTVSVGVRHVWQVEYADLITAYARRPVEVLFIGVGAAQRAGVLAVEQLVNAHPKVTIIAFGGPTDVVHITSMINAGASGFLRWPTVSSGEFETSTRLNAGMGAGLNAVQSVESSLTEREKQVLQGMSQGLTNAGIGRTLHLSEDTIKTHARRLFRKLGVADRAEAVAHGFRRTLIT
jgi:DNA-binding NarL/FixJ family response regulator